MLVRHGRIVRADQPAQGHEQEGEGLRTPSSVAAGASRGRARSKSLRCLCALRLRFDFMVTKRAVSMPKQACRLLLSRFLAASKRMSMRIVAVKEKVCSGVLYIAVFATETCQFARNGHRKLPSCDQPPGLYAAAASGSSSAPAVAASTVRSAAALRRRRTT